MFYTIPPLSIGLLPFSSILPHYIHLFPHCCICHLSSLPSVKHSLASSTPLISTPPLPLSLSLLLSLMVLLYNIHLSTFPVPPLMFSWWFCLFYIYLFDPCSTFRLSTFPPASTFFSGSALFTSTSPYSPNLFSLVLPLLHPHTTPCSTVHVSSLSRLYPPFASSALLTSTSPLHALLSITFSPNIIPCFSCSLPLHPPLPFHPPTLQKPLTFLHGFFPS